MNDSKNIKQSSIKAAKWSSVTEIVVKLIQPVSNMILARILVPEAFAAIALINMVVSFADIFTDAGFQKYLIQTEFKDDKEKKDATNVAFWTNFGISITLWLIIAIFRNPIAANIGNPTLGMGIAVAALALPMTSFSSIQMALFKRGFDFRILFYSRVIGALIPFCVTIPLALLGIGYWSIVIGTLCGRVFDAVFLTIKSNWKPELFYKVDVFKRMFSFSAWTLVESITVWFTVWIGVFIVGRILNDYYTGLYTTAMNTVNSIMSIVVSASTGVLFSTLSRLQNNDDEFLNVFLKFQRIVAMFVIPMGIGILVYQRPVTYFLLGEQWLEASCLVGIWAFSYSFSIVYGNLISEIYRSKGKPKLSVLAQLLHIVVLAPICFIFAKIDFVSLAYARSLCRFEFVFVHFIIVYAVFKISPIQMIKNVFPYILSALIMGGAGAIFQKVAGNYITALLTIPLCMVIYLVLLLLNKKTRAEVFGIKDSIRRK